jgi:hypothetical protein
MKLQFSLATLLVCMTVLALVCCIAAVIPVHESVVTSPSGPPFESAFGPIVNLRRRPELSEVIQRATMFSLPAVGIAMVALWSIRRLKSRRENGPPGG